MNYLRKLPAIFSRNAFVLLCWGIWLGLHGSNLILSVNLSLVPMFAAALVIFCAMIGCIFTVNHYADQLAELLDEPFGTLLLTLSVAIIEVSLMLVVIFEGDKNPSMLRDTVYATLMIMLNGMIGLSLVAGGWRHFEQTFNLRGAMSFLHLIVPLVLILLVMPNSTLSTGGPTLSPVQEIFMGGLCILVYVLFLVMQTTRHKALFVHQHVDNEHLYISVPPQHSSSYKRRIAIAGAALGLVVAIVPVVLLAEYLGDVINHGIEVLHAPVDLAALIIASLVLAPEGLSAYRAATANHMQKAMNICLGSALSTIALTVPCMLLVAGLQNIDLNLGVIGGSSTLLYATLLTTLITLSSERTTMLQGNVHLMIFLSYLFFIFYP
ncbi:calcium:proton antiporter [Methylobacter psychrophilus]|uniref:calcium:proton antiporter n=1 Tax=Methylobacter psychrophilus TaxID=96941 RepID=UPI0021D49A2E|nr:calcium/proton transporter [Methylobacter psychrophilus]